MTKIISSYSSFANVLFGISERSILGLLLFNAHISDIFDDIDDLDFCKFFGWQYSIFLLIRHDIVLGQIKRGIDKVFPWFKKKILKENADKCYLITSSKAPAEIEVSNITIMDEERFELLESYTDNKLNFDYHISELRKNCML